MLLALLFVAMAFASCNKGEGGDVQNVTDKFFLSASSKTCKVYYPESYNDTNLYSSVKAIASLMQTRAGITTELLCYTEYVDDGAPAVLVGKTGHEASESFMSEIKYSDYGYAVIGNKLCIGAHTTGNYSKL